MHAHRIQALKLSGSQTECKMQSKRLIVVICALFRQVQDLAVDEAAESYLRRCHKELENKTAGELATQPFRAAPARNTASFGSNQRPCGSTSD